MKKRYLRKSIQIYLDCETLVLIAFIGMINDFSLRAIPVLAVITTKIITNAYLLKTYGKDSIYE